MEDVVKALVGGGISTPSVGNPVSSEGEGIPEQVPTQSPRSKELKSSSSQEDEEENSADYNSGTLETDGAEHSTTVTTTSAGTCSSSEEGNVCSKEAASTSDTSEVMAPRDTTANRREEFVAWKDSPRSTKGGHSQGGGTSASAGLRKTKTPRADLTTVNDHAQFEQQRDRDHVTNNEGDASPEGVAVIPRQPHNPNEFRSGKFVPPRTNGTSPSIQTSKSSQQESRQGFANVASTSVTPQRGPSSVSGHASRSTLLHTTPTPPREKTVETFSGPYSVASPLQRHAAEINRDRDCIEGNQRIRTTVEIPRGPADELNPRHPEPVITEREREVLRKFQEFVRNLEQYGTEQESTPPAMFRGEQSRTYSFYNDDDDSEQEDHSEENTAEEEDMEVQTRSRDVANVEDDHDELYPTEAEKRKERRHAQASREREGERRRREGLPRNYLLIDSHTKIPYGQGVGNWRKELMLLSRKLDPAIGNINKHPQTLVKEIADWIQHTWEYSEDISDKYVKEVIARGVSLRRSDLWKKIRSGERKPDDVSDRSWRSLARELENPASIRKADICSRANASRLNFGRTGPSGEVGVRERLRKKLKRSPEPEEINFEMARDKGYGGQSKRIKSTDNIMHGSRDEDVRLDEEEIHRNSGGAAGQSPEYSRSPQGTSRGPIHLRDGGRQEWETAPNTTDSSRVLSISEEDLARHPMVMRMMERLEALEGKKTTDGNLNGAGDDLQEQLPTNSNVEEVIVAQNSEGNQVGKEAANVGCSQTIRKSSRAKMKAKQP